MADAFSCLIFIVVVLGMNHKLFKESVKPIKFIFLNILFTV